ncbi:MAG TPA: bifunctional 5,10-methylenetetrahydrofolate dehydrogenase/5,10-methenyltetrahydrofolate cyclohydrolase [Thermodesulfovibrionia bacterium]|nr:bifunctional 5,10-methylenetetrahydrofolate dehydrogenase/5,10-methenyltetrahydrofolate cyclohydrolase [Thermodesulfovibrionia bacterium]
MAIILDGTKLAKSIKDKVREDVRRLRERGIDTGLAILLVGRNPASSLYFSATLKASKGIGITVYEYRLPEDTTMNEILNLIHNINHDERINGLLILFPLPRNINARRVVNSLAPEKDVDGLGAISVGRLAADETVAQLFQKSDEKVNNEKLFVSAFSFLPCTPFGVIRLLDSYGVDLKGKDAVVVGKSLAVGKPLAHMLLAKEATVTICHKETSDLSYYVKRADIVCSATGVRGLIKGDMLKKGAVVVDIGINVMSDKQIVGDVDFSSACETASMITPVPGGVGPVTIAMLLENTVRSAQRHELLSSPFVQL